MAMFPHPVTDILKSEMLMNMGQTDVQLHIPILLVVIKNLKCISTPYMVWI